MKRLLISARPILILTLSLWLILGESVKLADCETTSSQVNQSLPLLIKPTLSNEVLVERCEKRAFDYFWQEADAKTGLVKDRANNWSRDQYTVSSMAATGFGLAALVIGSERGWITRTQAYERAQTTLQFCLNKMAHQRGWFYHFVNKRTGERVWQSEISSIDTALLLAGALLIGQYFKDTEVQGLANTLYERVDFRWMLTNGGAKPQEKYLCHGWTPEKGFIPHRWNSYSEHMILYLLAIGSPTHPIPAHCWDAWARPVGEYAGHPTFAIGPLFTHQFSHAFVDFRGKRDRLGYDYWQSSVEATLANRQFCIDQAKQFRTYSANVWGLSASDGPDGYKAYGAPPGHIDHDGTVAPLSVVASIVFTPDVVLASMRHMYANYGAKVWGRYGFCDAFNLDRNWFDKDVIGIDVGCALLMLKNYRSGLIWRYLGQIAPVQQAMSKVGFTNSNDKVDSFSHHPVKTLRLSRWHLAESVELK